MEIRTLFRMTDKYTKTSSITNKNKDKILLGQQVKIMWAISTITGVKLQNLAMRNIRRFHIRLMRIETTFSSARFKNPCQKQESSSKLAHSLSFWIQKSPNKKWLENNTNMTNSISKILQAQMLMFMVNIGNLKVETTWTSMTLTKRNRIS